MEFLENGLDDRIYITVIIIVLCFIAYRALNRFIYKTKTKDKINYMIGEKSETYLHVYNSISNFIFIIITLLIVLKINGVNISSMLAGIGLASAIIGLAVQDVLRDMIRGLTILTDDYYKIGDVIKFEGIEGKVVAIGLRTTKIKDIKNQNVIAIANRKIEQVEVISTQLDIEVPFSIDMKKIDAENILKEILESIENDVEIISCNYIGIQKMDDSSLNYLVRIQCDAENKYQTMRDSQSVIIGVLNKHNIMIPFKQIKIHS